MNFTCPSCGAEGSLDVLFTHDELRRLMAAVLVLSLPLGALVARYLRLFKPAKQALRADRMRRLLETLLPDMQRGAIARRGRDWPLTVDAWKLGLEAVLDAHAKGKLDLPLQDHAYLHEVLMRLADKHEAVAEREREAARRGRVATEGVQSVGKALATPAPATPAAPPPDYSGPSPHARRVKAEIEARAKAREDASKGDSQPDPETAPQ